jgi:hypothetical protein
MRGVIIQDQLDRGIRGINCIEPFEEAGEFARPMTLLDTRMYRAGEPVEARVLAISARFAIFDPGEQAEGAMALVFMVLGEALLDPRVWWQVGCSIADRLDARLFVGGDDRDVPSLACSLAGIGTVRTQNRDLAINVEYFSHCLFKRRVAPFQVIADFV